MPSLFLSHSQMPARIAPARTLAAHSAMASAVRNHHYLSRTSSVVRRFTAADGIEVTSSDFGPSKGARLSG
jgi:hypothetical protein